MCERVVRLARGAGREPAHVLAAARVVVGDLHRVCVHRDARCPDQSALHCLPLSATRCLGHEPTGTERDEVAGERAVHQYQTCSGLLRVRPVRAIDDQEQRALDARDQPGDLTTVRTRPRVGVVPAADPTIPGTRRGRVWIDHGFWDWSPGEALDREHGTRNSSRDVASVPQSLQRHFRRWTPRGSSLTTLWCVLLDILSTAFRERVFRRAHHE
jgi:hypothetical protein